MNKPTSSPRSISGLTIFGLVLLASAALVIVIFLVLPDRDSVPDQVNNPDAVSGSIAFREDALLTFASSQGIRRAAIVVEIAADDATRTKGLMGRTSLDETQGMLFIFPEEDMRSFWMANTPLPLDIIFVDASRKIVTIQRNTVPYSEESVPSTAPAQYVVEVNAGFCDRHDIIEGDVISWMESGS